MKLVIGHRPLYLKRMYSNESRTKFIGFYSDPRYIWVYKNDQGLDQSYSMITSIPKAFGIRKQFYI